MRHPVLPIPHMLEDIVSEVASLTQSSQVLAVVVGGVAVEVGCSEHDLGKPMES